MNQTDRTPPMRCPFDMLRHVHATYARYGGDTTPAGWGCSRSCARNIGYSAAVSTWHYHVSDPKEDGYGFHRLYADTPAWVVTIAERFRWIAKRGTLRSDGRRIGGGA